MSDSGEIATLRVVDLAFGFSNAPLLFENLSFEAVAGDVIGLSGPSGSGKSTLLSIIAGWEEPRSGHARLQAVGKVNWVFQNPHGVANRTALDHVAFPFLASGENRRNANRKARPILNSFRLSSIADRVFRDLSGGEAQRLMLARAVASRPDLLLVDEPTAQLDVRTSETVNATLAAVAGSGAIVLIATHDEGTRAACHRVIHLEGYAPLIVEEVGR